MNKIIDISKKLRIDLFPNQEIGLGIYYLNFCEQEFLTINLIIINIEILK